MLKIENLSISYKKSSPVINKISFSLSPGETLALAGASGSGKSSIGLAIMRLLKNAEVSGSIVYDHKDLLSLSEPEMAAIRGKQMAMVFQDALDALNPTMTIGKQIAEAMRTPSKEAVVELMGKVGLPDPGRKFSQYPFELSGGQRQRAVIAIALAGPPRLLIADEPTTALDPTIQAQILDLLKTLQNEFKMALLLITHDLGVVARIADRAAIISDGEIVEEGAVEKLFEAPKSSAAKKMIDKQRRLYVCRN